MRNSRKGTKQILKEIRQRNSPEGHNRENAREMAYEMKFVNGWIRKTEKPPYSNAQIGTVWALIKGGGTHEADKIRISNIKVAKKKKKEVLLVGTRTRRDSDRVERATDDYY